MKTRLINNLKKNDMQKNIPGFDLDLISYGDAYNLQEEIFELVKANDYKGAILLLEHYPVITIGNNKNTGSLLVSREELCKQNVELVQSNRGGDITLHSPGQIVCYTILNLTRLKKDLSFFVHDLEEVIIDVLASYDIRGVRINKHRGVFTGDFKIASIGLRVRKWITLHGFSLNVNNDLKYFDNIIACGLKDHPQTSMKKISKKTIPIHDVKEQILKSFSSIFEIPVTGIIKF
ncbi:lipoyl(octanoyl) transferase [Candidatus Atribacteria bacterium RBG_16_35_8]|nr:MAG: lipoyl(octanoyl) transferase [Candidatus Atribacteria bacterium RBG_16_35_8]